MKLLENRNYSYLVFRIGLGPALMLLPAALLATAASAQDQPPQGNQDTIDLIIVTGSRIPRADIESLQPVTVLDAERLALRGASSLATALNEQAGFAVPGSSPIDLQSPSTVGQNIVNFLGLGLQRTLTLVNGHRFPAGVSPQSTSGGLAVDLNAIPEILVDRVETIAIGGAPIYGSDAIAGTVNIILKDNFEGLQFTGSLGGSPEFHDASESRFGGVWGTNYDNDRGNIAASLQVTSADGLKYTDRPSTATYWGFEAPEDPASPYAQQLFNNLVVAVDNIEPFPLFFGDVFFFGLFGNAIPLDINDPASPSAQFDSAGNLVPYVPGGGTGSPIFQNGGDGLHLSELSSLSTDINRFNFNVFGGYELTNSVRLKFEGWFAKSNAQVVINQPQYNSPAFGGLPDNDYGNVGAGPIPILLNNPYLPAATRNSISSALDVVHDFDNDGEADPTIDTDGDGIADAVGFWRGGSLSSVMGANRASASRHVYRAVAGLEGDLDISGRNYVWDISISYGRTQSEDIYTDIIQPRFDQAVQVTTDISGDPVCVDTSSGCVPLDVVGTPSREAVNFVLTSVIDETTIEQRIFAANIAGQLAKLPAGPVGTAAGFTFREEKASYNPNDLAESGFTRFTQLPVNGEFHSTELYAEALVPLLGGDLETSFVEALEFEGSIRLVDNSSAGRDTTWTAGLRYRPIESLEFRGNATESIRAPSITELFTPESEIFVFADDPCDARFINQGNVPAVRAANCAGDGITQPFTSFIANASQLGRLSGNPDLESEVADSETIGLILRPQSLNGLTASIDWFNIAITNAIENLNAEDIMVACYDSSNFSSEPLCSLFDRDAAGQIIDVRTGFVNVGLLEFTGLQSVFSYELSLERLGQLRLGLNHLYTEKHIETPGSGNSRRLDGEIGSSEHRINLSAIWSRNDWTVFSQIRWLSGAVFDSADDASTRNITAVDDWMVVDSSVSYFINEDFEVQLNIDNLFDNDPPYGAIASGAGITTYYPGVRGRYVTLTFRAVF